MDRVLTGIEGLDKMLHGGFVRNMNVILSGGPGSGKTSFCYQYLYSGVDKYNQNGLYISLEQTVEKAIEGAKAVFQWDWDKYLGKNLIFTRIKKNDFSSLADIIEAYVNQNKVERVVIDSITLLKLYYRTDDAFRNNLYDLLDFLSSLNCTSLLTAEKSYTKRGEAEFTIGEFVADGVLNLYLIPDENDRIRAVEILKMRETSHDTKLVPFNITPNGIVIEPETRIFKPLEV